MNMYSYPQWNAVPEDDSLWSFIAWREWQAFLVECEYHMLVEIGVIR